MFLHRCLDHYIGIYGLKVLKLFLECWRHNEMIQQPSQILFLLVHTKRYFFFSAEKIWKTKPCTKTLRIMTPQSSIINWSFFSMNDTQQMLRRLMPRWKSQQLIAGLIIQLSLSHNYVGNVVAYFDTILEKTCFQNKSKFITQDNFVQHMNITIKQC